MTWSWKDPALLVTEFYQGGASPSLRFYAGCDAWQHLLRCLQGRFIPLLASIRNNGYCPSLGAIYPRLFSLVRKVRTNDEVASFLALQSEFHNLATLSSNQIENIMSSVELDVTLNELSFNSHPGKSTRQVGGERISLMLRSPTTREPITKSR